MADETSKIILDAIFANHAHVVSLIDGLAQSTQAGFDRVEARLDRVEADIETVKVDLGSVKTDVRDLQSAVARIETKLVTKSGSRRSKLGRSRPAIVQARVWELGVEAIVREWRQHGRAAPSATSGRNSSGRCHS